MLTPKLCNLLSICFILSANTPVFAQPKPTELPHNNTQLITQLVANQWRRFNLDSNSSIMMPGISLPTQDGIKSRHQGVGYFATSQKVDAEVVEKCTIYNCEIVLGMIVAEVVKEQNLTLQDAKPIQVNSQNYPASAVEYLAKNTNGNSQLKGRIYLVGNRLYILGAATGNSFFDNETNIFLESLSLI